MTGPSRWAVTGGVKTDRAKEHIDNLEPEIRAFITNNYVRTIEDDPETGDRLYVIEPRAEPPPRWGAIAGEVLHNLHSALDVLWRQAVPGGEDRKDTFPMFRTAKDCKARRGGKKNSPGERAMNIIKQIEPYPTGQGWRLLCLRQASDEDKHHVLISVGAAVVTAVPMSIVRMGPVFSGTLDERRIYPLNKRTIVHRIASARRQSQMSMDVQAIPEIAFGETALVGAPILRTLRELHAEVANVVAMFAAQGLVS